MERLRDTEIETILQHAIERVLPKTPSQDIEGEVPSSQTLLDSSQDPVADEVSVEQTALPRPKLRGISPEIVRTIVNLSLGDARTALSLLELVLTSPDKCSDGAIISQLRRTVTSRYDRSGEDRYNMISALHKSIRGSDGGAALYWLAR